MNQRKILVTINGYTKPLRQWADEYDIDYKAMHKRFTCGDTGEVLIRPERMDMLTPQAVRKLWHGRWVYRNGESRKYRRPWVYRTKPRTLWVYVGT